MPKRASRSGGVLTVLCIVVGFLIALVVILYLEETWRARRAWLQCKRDLEAQGEKLDGRSFIPPLVPDDQNFAMAPLLAPINDYVKDPKSGEEVPRNPKAVEKLKSIALSKLSLSSQPMPTLGSVQTGRVGKMEEWQRWLLASSKSVDELDRARAAHDVLSILADYAPDLTELTRAADRPYARFPLQYEKGFTMPLRHSQVMMGFGGVLCLRGLAELDAGDAEAALRDLKTLDRMQAALQPEPLLISHLVRLAVLNYIPQIVWQGIVQHRWNDAQLINIQETVSRADLLADYVRVVRGERALGNDFFDMLRRKHANIFATANAAIGIQDARPRPVQLASHLLPQNAILYQNQVWQNRWIQGLVLPVVDVKAGKVYPRREAADEEILRQIKPTAYNFLAKLSLPSYSAIAMRTAAADVLMRQVEVACALERFRLKTSHYPETLRELAPDYLPQLPHDLFADEPLHYRREAEGNYILYSVGWNEEDDGGAVVTKPGSPNRRDDQAGDWVWFGAVPK